MNREHSFGPRLSSLGLCPLRATPCSLWFPRPRAPARIHSKSFTTGDTEFRRGRTIESRAFVRPSSFFPWPLSSPCHSVSLWFPRPRAPARIHSKSFTTEDTEFRRGRTIESRAFVRPSSFFPWPLSSPCHSVSSVVPPGPARRHASTRRVSPQRTRSFAEEEPLNREHSFGPRLSSLGLCLLRATPCSLWFPPPCPFQPPRTLARIHVGR